MLGRHGCDASSSFPVRSVFPPLYSAIGQSFSQPARTSPASTGELEKAASWQWPDIALIQQHLISYLDQRQASEELRRRVLEHWKSTAPQVLGPALLERVLSTASLIEPRVAAVVGQLNDPQAKPILVQELTWLSSDATGWLQDAVRLACGRAFAQRQLYDEALENAHRSGGGPGMRSCHADFLPSSVSAPFAEKERVHCEC